MESKVDLNQPIRSNGSAIRQMTDKLKTDDELQVIIEDGDVVFSQQSFTADNGRKRDYIAVAFTVNGKGRKDISVSQVCLIHEDENPLWCEELEKALVSTLGDLEPLLKEEHGSGRSRKVVGRTFKVVVSETRTNFSGNPQIFLELA